MMIDVYKRQEQSNVMFQIYNTGKTTLYNVQVKFEADSVEGGDTFIGNLAPGATGNVDAMVNGIAATTDDGSVKAVLTLSLIHISFP